MLLVLVKNEGVKRVLHSDLPVLESSARLVVSDELKKALVSRKKSVAMVTTASVDRIEPRFVPLYAVNRVRGAVREDTARIDRATV